MVQGDTAEATSKAGPGAMSAMATHQLSSDGLVGAFQIENGN